jgi:hypothetical protein
LEFFSGNIISVSRAAAQVSTAQLVERWVSTLEVIRSNPDGSVFQDLTISRFSGLTDLEILRIDRSEILSWLIDQISLAWMMDGTTEQLWTVFDPEIPLDLFTISGGSQVDLCLVT